MFVQQSLQAKLSRRRYVSVSYAVQNNTVFRRTQNWDSVSDGSRADNGSEFQSVGPETAKQGFGDRTVLALLPRLTISVNVERCATRFTWQPWSR